MTTRQADRGIWGPSLAVVASWAAIGLYVLLGELVPWVRGTVLLAEFPSGLVMAIGATVAAGGVLELAGLLAWRRVSLGWALEKAGCALAATGWAAYGIAVSVAVGGMSVGTIHSAGFVAAAAARAWWVTRESRIIRQAVADHDIRPEDG